MPDELEELDEPPGVLDELEELDVPLPVLDVVLEPPGP